jgi:uncharacterized protein YecE (DUF72 family)
MPDELSCQDGIHIGCAGWSLRAEHRAEFPSTGTHLQQYASRFSGVEVNSCFYREHRPGTWRRWAESVPQGFRFSFKLPRTITHERCLRDSDELIERFADQVSSLGDRLGPLLVQLPPSLVFEPAVVDAFFRKLKRSFTTTVCEPRHASWFSGEAEAMLGEMGISVVAADPPRKGQAFAPGGSQNPVYYRLHGSPRIYWSGYSDDFLDSVAAALVASLAAGRAAWCILDNTAEGLAIPNALYLQNAVRRLQCSLAPVSGT